MCSGGLHCAVRGCNLVNSHSSTLVNLATPPPHTHLMLPPLPSFPRGIQMFVNFPPHTYSSPAKCNLDENSSFSSILTPIIFVIMMIIGVIMLTRFISLLPLLLIDLLHRAQLLLQLHPPVLQPDFDHYLSVFYHFQ